MATGDPVAESTTVNVPSPKPPKLGGNGAIPHTHGANFGKYVEGCAACAKAYPLGPNSPRVQRLRPKRKSKADVRFEAAQAAETRANAALAEMRAIEARMAERQQLAAEPPVRTEPPPPPIMEEKPSGVATDALVQIMLRKEAKELKDLEEADARREEGRKQMLHIVQTEARMKAQMQAACNHRMERGENAISGQVHSDGLFHPICVRCQKEMTPVRPHASELVGALP